MPGPMETSIFYMQEKELTWGKEAKNPGNSVLELSPQSFAL